MCEGFKNFDVVIWRVSFEVLVVCGDKVVFKVIVLLLDDLNCIVWCSVGEVFKLLGVMFKKGYVVVVVLVVVGDVDVVVIIGEDVIVVLFCVLKEYFVNERVDVVCVLVMLLIFEVFDVLENILFDSEHYVCFNVVLVFG